MPKQILKSERRKANNKEGEILERRSPKAKGTPLIHKADSKGI